VQKKEQVALLLLRVGLGFFLLVWSCAKFAAPEAAVGIFRVFYKIPISTTAAYAIGGVEALLSVLILAGAWKSYTYAIGLGLHTVSTIASWKPLISPFSPGHDLFVAAIPVLTAFIALYILRDRDVLWSLDNLYARRLERERNRPRRENPAL
jgi:putative oxidoreductase